MNKSFPLFVLENKELMRKKKADTKNTDDMKNAHEMHMKHNGPDGERNTSSDSVMRRCISSDVLETFLDLADIVTAIRIFGKVKFLQIQRLARSKTQCPQCSGMVTTFITQMSTVTVHVLHGEPSCVGRNSRTVDMRAPVAHVYVLYRAQANSSSVLGITINTRVRITDYRTMWTKRGYRSNHGSHFSSVVGMCFGTSEGKMSLGGDDGTKHDISSSME